MKRNKYILYVLLLGAGLFYSCTEDDGPSIDDYPLNYQIPEVPVTTDIPVGIFLYNPTSVLSDNVRWTRITEPYDQATGKIGPNVEPILGRYALTVNDAGAQNLQQLVDWCKDAKVNFIVSPLVKENPNVLYPKNINAADSAFTLMLSGQHPTFPIDLGDMKYTILMDLNNFCANLKLSSNDSLIEIVQPQKLSYTTSTGVKRDTIRTGEQRLYSWVKRVSDYFKDPTYLHINGRPVLMFSNPERLYTENSKKVYDNIRDTIKANTGKDVYIIARQAAWTPPARFHYFFMSGQVDAVTMENMCYVGGSYYERIYWLNQLINENFKYNREYIAQNYGIDFMPSVAASYNMYVNNGSVNIAMVNKNPDEFRKRCNVAKMNLGKIPMVFVESLNNWQYNSQLEPTIVKEGTNGYGTTYLDILREQFKR